ncbi:Alpha/Beta hydrolase protein [Phaeosphaeriaceae sp. PMI808]|nr:Alpha/Beta hydrolase protein [Phaeosphaeriaceae sp. PMI808]
MAAIHKVFKSPFFQFEFLRLLAMAPHEGAEIGEALEAAAKIKDLDPESWYSAFLEAGKKSEEIAKEAEKAGDRIGARRAYLRSSNYLRAAQFMLNEGPIGHDKRSFPLSKMPSQIFAKGPQDSHTAQHWWRDSTQEEIYFVNPAFGPEVGYAVITFEGPGQGIVLRRDKLPIRPDWEKVTGPVLDICSTMQPDILSLSSIWNILPLLVHRWGFLALRAAADPRIKACVSTDGFYSLNPDGTEYLADVKCPTLVTGAGSSMYFDPATTTDKIYDCLTNLKDGVDKEKWIEHDIARGGLQAKIGAFGYSAQRTFQVVR